MRREGPPRVVALLVPDLPLQRIERGREPIEGGRPLAVVADGRILCRNAAARAEGVRPGATLAEALAACGRLAHVPAEPAADRAALRALAEAMLGLAPVVEVSAPDGLLLDASAAHLLAPCLPAPASSAGGRPPGGAVEVPAVRRAEEGLAGRAVALAAEMGYVVRAAIATGRGPAGALARHADRAVAWIAPAGAASAVAPLPVAALGLAPGVAARLAALGVDSAGALARLPEGTLAHRFGPEGVLAARLARGEDGSPLVPYVPETLPEEALDLEGPAESAEPLLFGLKRLADRVAARLAGRGLGATRLKIVLRLDPRGEERLLVPLAAATAVPGRWLLPVKEHLFSLRLPAPVVGLRLAAIEVAAVAAEQLAIGDRPEALAALEGVLARLAVRLGDGALFAAEEVERYRPEGAYRAVPFPVGRRRQPHPPAPLSMEWRRSPDASGVPGAGAGARPTRLLAAPAPVVAEGEGGRFTALRVEGRARAIAAIDGPERLRGEWWAPQGAPDAERGFAAGTPLAPQGAPDAERGFAAGTPLAPQGAPDAERGFAAGAALAGAFDRDYYRVRLEGLGDCWVYRDGGDGRIYIHGFFD